MKTKFPFILTVLLLITMFSCKEDIDICEGVQKEGILNKAKTIELNEYYWNSYVKPIIQDNFIFLNASSHEKGNVILKIDFDTYDINNVITGSLVGNSGFHDNNYYFYKGGIISGQVSYIDLETMERNQVVMQSDKSKAFIHNEIFDKDYVIFYNLKEVKDSKQVFEIFRFIPNTTESELIGEFSVDQYMGQYPELIRHKRLWRAENGSIMFAFSSEITGERSFISTYNISSNLLLFRKTLSYDDNGTNKLIEYYKTYFLKDKIFVTTSEGEILVYDVNNGELLWNYTLDYILFNTYIDEKSSIAYISTHVRLTKIDLNTGIMEQIIEPDDNHKVIDIEYDRKNQMLAIPFENSIAYVLSKDDDVALELGTKINLCSIDNVSLDGTVRYLYNIKESKKILLLEDNQIEVVNYDF